jgi:hypothetical protein
LYDALEVLALILEIRFILESTQPIDESPRNLAKLFEPQCGNNAKGLTYAGSA